MIFNGLKHSLACVSHYDRSDLAEACEKNKGPYPYVALTLGRHEIDEFVSDEKLQSHIDLIELRLDSMLKDSQDLESRKVFSNVVKLCLRRDVTFQYLLTLRTENEGGEARFSAEEYVLAISRLLSAFYKTPEALSHVAGIDIEIRNFHETGEDITEVIENIKDKTVILSSHITKPFDLKDNLNLLCKEYEKCIDTGIQNVLIKLAVEISNKAELKEFEKKIAEFRSKRRMEAIFIPLGKEMMNERVSNPCFKSPIYFAKRERDETTGQLDAIELCKLLIAQN
ncbi:putative 3-dehydroquinate dehydratase, type I [Eubacterium saphenum ATCC 49989]|nr:putative 3-dehydroquinate dehydratase, type I [Eubacterium saphenum ATCC 49989]